MAHKRQCVTVTTTLWAFPESYTNDSRIGHWSSGEQQEDSGEQQEDSGEQQEDGRA